MRGYFHLFLWFCLSWFLVVIVLYQSLGVTGQDRSSLGFALALGATVIGGAAFLILLGASAVEDVGSSGADFREPEFVPGRPTWDDEFTTGSTGDELEDLGLVKHEPPLPNDAGRRGV